MTEEMSTRPELVQFGDLTPDHFARHPVWVEVHIIDYDEPWYDDTDEETVRPWTAALPVDPGEARFLVRARVELADGSRLVGFVTPQPEAAGEVPDLGYMQPHLFAPGGRLHRFWDGGLPRSEEARAAFYRDLAKRQEAIFPIHFAAEPGLSRGIQVGTLEGFYSCSHPDGPVKVVK
jgi:hypothetical protein